eukprot:738233-Hanusia_phi.AAC.2
MTRITSHSTTVPAPDLLIKRSIIMGPGAAVPAGRVPSSPFLSEVPCRDSRDRGRTVRHRHGARIRVAGRYYTTVIPYSWQTHSERPEVRSRHFRGLKAASFAY